MVLKSNIKIMKFITIKRMEKAKRNDILFLKNSFISVVIIEDNFSSVYSELILWVTSRIKTVRAGERDCPQDNQAVQASADFRFETGRSIVFICCCATFNLILLRR